MTGGPVHFRGRLTEANGVGGRWVECPFDGKAVFGSARAPVVGTVNGHAFRTRLMVYGGVTVIGFVKAVREAAGIEDGAELDISLSLDDQPREVVVPDELRTALDAAPDAAARFDALAFTHRKEYAVWVGEAKQAATRERRAAKAVEMLTAGVPHP